MLKHVSIRRVFFFPFLATTLIEPHATDVFQETCSAIHATFVRKIKSKTFVSNNGFRQFYAHQAPCSRAEISKFPVLCRHGGNSRSRIMPCHGNDRHLTQARQLLHFLTQCADNGARKDHTPHLFTLYAHAVKQFPVKLTGNRIQQFRRRSYRVFAHRLAREHVRKCIWNKQYFVGNGKRFHPRFAHSIELKQRVKVHKLYTRLPIHLLFWHYSFKETLHHAYRVRVTVSHGIT